MIGSLTDYYKASCKRSNTSKKKCAFFGHRAILIRSPESTNVHLKGGWALLAVALQLSFYTTRGALLPGQC